MTQTIKPSSPKPGGPEDTMAAGTIVDGAPAPVIAAEAPPEAAVVYTPANFWQQPWVQNVLPFMTSLALHAAIIVLGLLVFGVYKAVSAPPHEEQVIIPESSLATEGPPGGVPNEGPNNNPLQQAMQDKDPSAGTPEGFAEKQGPSVDLTNLGGTAGDSNDSTIEVGPGGGFNRGKGLLGDAAGAGASDSGAVRMFGAPGGGGMGPKGPVFGNGGNARRITFVCDATGTMLPKMEALKVELSKVVHDLKPIQAFNVVFFHEEGAYALDRDSLEQAVPENKRKFDEFLKKVVTSKGGNPLPGIELAMKQKPELIYLLTDGEFPDSNAVAARIKQLNADGKIKINTIAFVNSEDKKFKVDEGFKKLLKRVSDENGGTFKDVNADDL